jgi:hypothetical protein
MATRHFSRRWCPNRASPVEAPEAPSSDDASVLPRFVGIGGQRLVGLEMLVALDGEAELTADGQQLR